MIPKLTILAHGLLAKTRKIDMIPIRVDIQELDPWPKVIHELPQRPRRDGPVMWRVLSVELGVHRHRNLEG